MVAEVLEEVLEELLEEELEEVLEVVEEVTPVDGFVDVVVVVLSMLQASGDVQANKEESNTSVPLHLY